MIAVSPSEKNEVTAIIKKHAPHCKVLVIGSRMKGTHRKSSDLDLVFVGEKRLDLGAIGALKEDFMESGIPFKVDVLDYYAVSPAFRAIIDRGNVVLYDGGGEPPAPSPA